MGHVLDGVSPHMRDYPEDQTFVVADEEPCNVEKVLQETGAEVLLNYLPVGSEEATRFYATCCLNTGVSLINCMPVFIVSYPDWRRRLPNADPVVGDDVRPSSGRRSFTGP